MRVFILLVMALVAAAPAQEAAGARRSGETPIVGYCELRSNAEAYFNKPIRLRAVYTYGFEWQEFNSSLCEGGGRMWVEFADDVEERSSWRGRRWLRNDRDAETAGLVVLGRLVGAGGHFGHMNAYDSLFIIDAVESAVVLDKEGRKPTQLSPRYKKRVEDFERGEQ